MELIEVIGSVHWEPSIGDPTVFAWLTVLVYMVAAFGCGKCAMNAARIFNETNVFVHRILWWAMTAVLFFLGINKQLDLQTWFTRVAKAIARHYDFMALGQWLQVLFVVGLATISIGAMGWVAWRVRSEWRRYILWLIGALFIIRFVLVRVGLFYGVPLPRVSRLTGGVQLNWLLEFLGALILAFSAFLNLYIANNKSTQVSK